MIETRIPSSATAGISAGGATGAGGAGASWAQAQRLVEMVKNRANFGIGTGKEAQPPDSDETFPAAQRKPRSESRTAFCTGGVARLPRWPPSGKTVSCEGAKLDRIQ